MKITKIKTNYNSNILFEKIDIKPDNEDYLNDSINITIMPSNEKQNFIGFGAALTEASAYCFSLLSKQKQNEFLNDCFGENGLNYNISRLTIASSDFSFKSYSYSNKKDLSDFSTKKDEEYVIPFIKRVQEYKQDIKFLASPWSPPRFMKSNKLLIFGGRLLEKYYQTYANYISKYIIDYKSKGINIDYITIQNEPEATQVWESCRYTAEQEANFAVNFLFPTFKENNINTKIIAWDHNKDLLLERVNKIMNYPKANDVIVGFGHHWYTGDYFEDVNKTHKMFKDKLLIHTEGCTGFSNFNPNDEIKNAEMYAHDIIGDLANGTISYIDWNILLDNKGGPNHKKNYCNSPIMLNKDNNDYIKMLPYYYIKHFSNIIKPNAKLLSTLTDNTLETLSFKNEDKSIAIIILNRTDDNAAFTINLENTKINDIIASHEILSYLINA